MSSRNMKLDEIKARAEEAVVKADERKREAMESWQAHEDQGNQVRLKTERLKAQRLAREAAEAEALAAAPPPAPKRRRSPAVAKAS